MNEDLLTSVIVTYNRKFLLNVCLSALSRQSTVSNKILVLDNASTDGTSAFVANKEWPKGVNVSLLIMGSNSGGAGGFSAGLKHALDNGAEWIWMMDDDAEPHPDALKELRRVATDPACVYGSLAVNGEETAWLTTVLDPPLGEVSRADNVPECAEVQSLPFLGFLIHRNLVERIGLPDAGFFIAADDTEYCIRAQRAGAKIMIAGKSRIEHPKSRPTHVRIFGRNVIFLSLPPWKRYYDTRNRLLIARKYYGIRLFTQTIPGSFVRLFATLLKEPHKLTQLHAFAAGFIDGVLGIKGKRHEWWRIR